MTDVTGAPLPTGASPFNVPGDLKALADHFGDQTYFSVATTASLPTSGNWPGRILHVEDIDVIAEWTGSAWRRFYPVHAMQQGTVACPGTGAVLSGIGWSDLITISFTAGRFSSPPHVKVQTVGPADQIAWGGVVQDVTTSGAKVRGLRAGSIPSSAFSVEWTAVQMVSGSAIG